MQPGDSCEAFITNVQGKTIGHVVIACESERLLLTTVPDQADTLLAHLDRYLITEDVELANESANYRQVLISGSEAAAVLRRVFCIDAPDGQTSATCQEQPCIVWRMPFAAADTFAVIVSAGGNEVDQLLVNAGASEGDDEAIEFRRIEHRFPWFGRDLTDKTLPQEVDRNDEAISFTKGCYLGQETVARIDALGHVNKLLVRVRADQELAVGDELLVSDKATGIITSTVAGAGHYWGLATIRREHATGGCKLKLKNGVEAVVV
jgi:folate-binding protein YgfZ